MVEILSIQNFYPRPPRGGRHSPTRLSVMRYIISIHALREEGDRYLYCFIADFGVFLSTPSARRATSTSSLSRTGWSGFLSTPSARRATLSQGVKSGKSVYFYPRPPRGGRQVRHTSLTGNGHISIHALREEGDLSTKVSTSK